MIWPNELDVYNANWAPASDANHNVIIRPTNTVTPVLDAAHLISGDPAAGQQGNNVSTSGGPSPIFIAHNTKMNLEEEYVGGVERQYAGFVLSGRYMDRRLLRIIEDTSGASPEGNKSGFVGQNFVVGNLSSKTDYFINEVETPYTFNAKAGPPANCPAFGNYTLAAAAMPPTTACRQQYRPDGPGGACGSNTATAGDPTPRR